MFPASNPNPPSFGIAYPLKRCEEALFKKIISLSNVSWATPLKRLFLSSSKLLFGWVWGVSSLSPNVIAASRR
jgi:hypothetical protein